jgi:Spy/CpxP family protein refolding chaperone
MAPASAQRGGGDLSLGVSPMQLSRLERLELVFKLDKDQKKAAKAIFDEAFKAAATARKELATTRAVLGQAVIAAKPQAEIDAAVKAYGIPAAAMATIEMQALADMLKGLTPEQRQNGAAIRTAFSMVRGMFLDEKKWDEIPKAQGY